MKRILQKFFPSTADPILLLSVFMIFGIGLLFLYSTSPQQTLTLNGNYALRQSLWMIVTLPLFLFIVSIHFKRAYDLAYLLYGFNLFLLILVLFLGRATQLGAQRWLDLGPIAFQPSEFVKITFILALSRFLSENNFEESPGKTLLGAFGFTLIPAFLILKEPHLGTALMLFVILFGILYAANLPWRYFIWMISTFLLLGPFGWFFLKDYQKERLLVFMNPNLDPLGAGYTVIQSRVSIGSGWFLGKGLFSGTQNMLRFLPERHTDFIFSVIGEEWGFVGATFLILLYLLVMKRGLAIAHRAKGEFPRLVTTGLTTMLTVHVFVNLAMTMGFLPVVGLPLPFVSYGGSWLLSCMLAIGLILCIGKEGDAY